ncbi:hypothetical protein HPB50_015070 [Hyalomma asiaticum]|uniref:Uncharacterized protein n=1 Tax=Hyalomma asiaticum TaxID=266040 RepID=A0ACB7SYI8_HYAAI|nr:hypothetical protein HPB50_015070 [Hyalomma asiaticum]
MTSPTKSIEVKLELGHRAVLRARPTAEGFTHDWTVFVRGPEGCNIQHFVDKVVFLLHESFPKPKRVIKEPPYQVSESGYAGFNMPVEVYFRTREDPKKVKFVYDLYLSVDGTPISNIRCEKLTFHNPPDDFCHKLLKAGGDMVKSPPVEQPPPPPPPPSSPPTPSTPHNPMADLFSTPAAKKEMPPEKSSKGKQVEGKASESKLPESKGSSEVDSRRPEKLSQKHRDKTKDKSSKERSSKEHSSQKESAHKTPSLPPPAPAESSSSKSSKNASAPRRPLSPPPPKKPKLQEPERKKKDPSKSHRPKDSPKKPPEYTERKPPEPPEKLPSPLLPLPASPPPALPAREPSPVLATNQPLPAAVLASEESNSPKVAAAPAMGPLSALMLKMEQEDLLSPLSSASASPTPTREVVAAPLAKAPPPPPSTADNLQELQELKKRILTLEDPRRLQAVVDLVEGTGLYKMTEESFDFDLCTLDKMTLERLQACLNGR